MDKQAKILTFVLLGVIGLLVLSVGLFMTGCEEEEKKVWFCGAWCYPSNPVCIPKEGKRSIPENWNECAPLSEVSCTNPQNEICGVWTTVGEAIEIMEQTCQEEAWIQEYDYIESCDPEVVCALYPCPSPSPSPSPSPA